MNYGGTACSIIGTNTGTILVAKADKIYRSTDQGNNWMLVLTAWDDIICFGRNYTSNYLYAGRITNSQHTQGGIYRSTDDGMSWIFKGLDGRRVNNIFVNNDGTVFAACSSGDVNWGGIWKSTDNGNTWTESLSALYDVFSIAKDDNGNLYAGTEDIESTGWGALLKSEDNGQTWHRIGHFEGTSKVRGVTIDHNGVIYAATGGGSYVYRSLDGGINWDQVLSGIDWWEIYPMVTNSINRVYLGTCGEGVYFTEDAGTTWTQVNSGLCGNCVYALALDNQEYLLAAVNTNYCKSTESTSSNFIHINVSSEPDAVVINVFPPANGVSNFTTPATLECDYGTEYTLTAPEYLNYPQCKQFLRWEWNGSTYTGYNYVNFTALNNNDTWKAVYDVIDPPLVTITANGPTTFCEGGSVTLTANDGSELTYQWLKDGVAIEGAIERSFIAEQNGNYAVKVTFKNCISSTSDPVSVIVIPIPLTPEITLENLVLHSNAESGNQWYRNGDIIPGATEQSYAVTQNGIYYDIVTVNGCSSLQSNEINITNVGINNFQYESFLKIYPNPSDNFYELHYKILSNHHVIIKLFDVMGNEKACIINEEQSKGDYLKIIDGTLLSPGIYYCCFSIDHIQITVKKIIKN